MPIDLSAFPHWQKLVNTNKEYRRAWLAGTFPPLAVRKEVEQASSRHRRQQLEQVNLRTQAREALKELIEDTGDATLLDLPKNWLRSINKWIKEGKPVRTDEEVQYLLENFCKPCPKFDTRLGLGYCKVCGCHVNQGKAASLNALRMATKECPIGKFPAKVK